MMSPNTVDRFYFIGKLNLILEGLENYTGDELARELHRLANTAGNTVHEWSEKNEQAETVDERAEFEDWVRKHYQGSNETKDDIEYLLQKNKKTYTDDDIQENWEGWQARAQLTTAKPVIVDSENRKNWSVSIEVGAENILTISNQHLAGISNIEDYKDVVEICINHLASFMGIKPVDAKPSTNTDDTDSYNKGFNDAWELMDAKLRHVHSYSVPFASYDDWVKSIDVSINSYKTHAAISERG